MNIIKTINEILIFASLIMIPILAITDSTIKSILWDLSLYAVFILMCIRPLSQLFPSLKLVRFIQLRKGLGIFSATVVVTYGLIHYFSLGFEGYLIEYFSINYWNIKSNLFWAHLGELTGFILLITSNKFSMRTLKRNWKRIQNLSYVYFFSGAWYVFTSFHKTVGILAIIIVFELTFAAYLKRKIKIDEITGNLSIG